ncbi:MAG TPA: 1,4-dihydroxy-2-naphthoate polyprenyltransferase [Acidobacteria bacterium]|nr:1,4-dihydroxy-2-naphthoate polyprenyltransferase [Acidobacteriota bacterium]
MSPTGIDAPATRAGAWWLAARPRTLPAAATPVVVGSSVAWTMGAFRLGPALAALLGALLIQIGTNFANDLFDFQKGADTAERQGPLRAVQAGLLTPVQVWVGIALSFGAATACGLYLTRVAGWPVVVIGLASLLAGLAYTGGPFPLAYNGLGDLFVLLFFGFVAVCGTVWVQALRLSPLAWLAGGTVGVLATAILVVNNVRDVEQDRRAGKRTLPVLLGVSLGRIEYALLLGASYLLPALAFRLGIAPIGVLAPVLTLPLAFRLVRVVGRSSDPRRLNRALASTALLLLLHGLLLSGGLLAGGVKP